MPAIRDWKIRKVNLVDAKPLPSNTRTITNKAQAGLKASMDRFGYVEFIVWNERTGHIIGGHQRYALLVDKGLESALMVVVDMSPEDEKDANLTLNNPHIEGEFSEPIMDLFKQMESANADAFSDLRMDDLRRSLEASLSKPVDDGGTPSPPSDTDTKCPCCGHEWKIDAKDVMVSEPET